MRGERLAHSENEIDWRGMCTGMLRSERPHLCSFPSVHVRRASLARAAISGSRQRVSGLFSAPFLGYLRLPARVSRAPRGRADCRTAREARERDT